MAPVAVGAYWNKLASIDEARASAVPRAVQHTYAKAVWESKKYRTAPATRPTDSWLPIEAVSPAPLFILNDVISVAWRWASKSPCLLLFNIIIRVGALDEK